LLLTRLGTSNRKLGLISHLDTVFPPEEEAANNFAWRPEGDRVYGPGTVDIKGGTVMIFMVLDALCEFDPKTFAETTWVILINSSEETLSNDFGALCLARLSEDALAALVFEGGLAEDNTFQLVTARKGMAVYRIAVEGKSSHAGSYHFKGANAIVQLAHTIQQIAALTDYSRDLTFNVGTITGGVVTNRVPHFAKARGEMRAFSVEVYDEALESLIALADQVQVAAADGNFPCKIEIEIESRTAPWQRNPNTEKLLALWQDVAQSLGMTVIREERGGLSDGNHIWAYLPTLDGLGPDGGNAHCSEHDPVSGKEQEFVRVSSFVPKAILNLRAIQRLLNVQT
jgi:glutamate carboxypeptidase